VFRTLRLRGFGNAPTKGPRAYEKGMTCETHSPG